MAQHEGTRDCLHETKGRSRSVLSEIQRRRPDVTNQRDFIKGASQRGKRAVKASQPPFHTMKIAGLIGVKKNSSSLPGKGWKDFGGKPMFQWNLEKGLKLLDEMYVTSDHDFVLEEANKLGAKLIKRNDPYLMECPNIVYYEYCMDYMDADALIAIQVNSPTVDPKLISITKQLLEMGVPEIITVHKNRDIYGSIWAMTRERLERYADPFTPSAEVFIIDESVDIHSKEDVEKAKEQCQLI
jgi:hypothetical protein